MAGPVRLAKRQASVGALRSRRRKGAIRSSEWPRFFCHQAQHGNAQAGVDRRGLEEGQAADASQQPASVAMLAQADQAPVWRAGLWSMPAATGTWSAYREHAADRYRKMNTTPDARSVLRVGVDRCGNQRMLTAALSPYRERRPAHPVLKGRESGVSKRAMPCIEQGIAVTPAGSTCQKSYDTLRRAYRGCWRMVTVLNSGLGENGAFSLKA